MKNKNGPWNWENFSTLTNFILPHTDTDNTTHKPIEAVQWGDIPIDNLMQALDLEWMAKSGPDNWRGTRGPAEMRDGALGVLSPLVDTIVHAC